ALHLPRHFAHQLATVAHFEFGEVVGLARDDVADLAQQLAASRGREPAPLAVQRVACRLHGVVDVLLASVRYFCPRLARIRIKAAVGLPGSRLDLGTADQLPESEELVCVDA